MYSFLVTQSRQVLKTDESYSVRKTINLKFWVLCYYMYKPEAKLDSGVVQRDEGVGRVGTTVVVITISLYYVKYMIFLPWQCQ